MSDTDVNDRAKNRKNSTSKLNVRKLKRKIILSKINFTYKILKAELKMEDCNIKESDWKRMITQRKMQANGQNNFRNKTSNAVENNNDVDFK